MLKESINYYIIQSQKKKKKRKTEDYTLAQSLLVVLPNLCFRSHLAGGLVTSPCEAAYQAYLTFFITGSAEANGFGGMVKLCPSPSDISTTSCMEGRSWVPLDAPKLHNCKFLSYFCIFFHLNVHSQVIPLP